MTGEPTRSWLLVLRHVLAMRERGVASARALRGALHALPATDRAPFSQIVEQLERGETVGGARDPRDVALIALAQGDALPTTALRDVLAQASAAARAADTARRSTRPVVLLAVTALCAGAAAAWVVGELGAALEAYSIQGAPVVAVLRYVGAPLAVAVVLLHRRGLVHQLLPGRRTFDELLRLRLFAAALDGGAKHDAAFAILGRDERAGIGFDACSRGFVRTLLARRGAQTTPAALAATARALADAVEDEDVPRALRQRARVLKFLAVGVGGVSIVVFISTVVPIFTLAGAMQ